MKNGIENRAASGGGVVERRSMRGIEVRAESGSNGEPKTIRAYGAVFNSSSSVLSAEGADGKPIRFIERILPGAFKRSLSQNPDVRSLMNHDPNRVLGRTKNGTLRLKEDDKGLNYEVDPNPSTTIGRDALALAQRGDIDSSSFGFRNAKDEWSVEDGMNVRTISDLDLVDCGPVAFPAYEDAVVIDVRSVEAAIEKLTPPPAAQASAPALKVTAEQILGAFKEMRGNTLPAELRALIEVDDKGVICCSRTAICYLRYALDSIQNVICEVRASAEAGAELTPEDIEALTDFWNQAELLSDKMELVSDVLSGAGVEIEDRDDEEDEDPDTDSDPDADSGKIGDTSENSKAPKDAATGPGAGTGAESGGGEYEDDSEMRKRVQRMADAGIPVSSLVRAAIFGNGKLKPGTGIPIVGQQQHGVVLDENMQTPPAAAATPTEARAGHMTHENSSPALNEDGVKNCSDLIGEGKVDKGKWKFTAETENKLLGDKGDDWDNYAKWHLGIDKNADAKSKKAYKYPYGDGTNVFLAALRAVRSRSSPKGPQPAKTIFDAAAKLLDAASKKEEPKK